MNCIIQFLWYCCDSVAQCLSLLFFLSFCLYVCVSISVCVNLLVYVSNWLASCFSELEVFTSHYLLPGGNHTANITEPNGGIRQILSWNHQKPPTPPSPLPFNCFTRCGTNWSQWVGNDSYKTSILLVLLLMRTKERATPVFNCDN